MAALSGILSLPTTSRTSKLLSSTSLFSHEMSTSHDKQRQLKITKVVTNFPVSTRKQLISSHAQYPLLHATLRGGGPKGFGPSPKKTKKKSKKEYESENDTEEEDEEDEEEEEEDVDSGVIPEVVTNRMINRMALTVGTPLFVGLLFFPFFYYLKVGLKIDVPTWVPFIVSFIFFGSALLGISYGIVSSSWDPMREGSLLGWTEAQKNWPVFWQSFRGGRSARNK